MLFVIETEDIPDGLPLRQATRPVHLDYLEGLGEALVLAGPFQNAAGQSVGSLLIVKAANLEEAEAMAAGDPFAVAGLFARSTVRPWVWTINKPEGLEA